MKILSDRNITSFSLAQTVRWKSSIGHLLILTVALFCVSSANGEPLSSPQNSPHVTIQATTAVAFEDGSGDGVFLISRDGSTAQALTVHLRISGNATNGVDYAAISNEVQIPAGSSSIEVRVKPINDTQVEEDELVTIGLADVPINSVFDKTLASVAIKDNDTVVQIEAADPNGSETGPRPMVFRIRRAGNIRSRLTVNYTVNANNLRQIALPIHNISDGSVRTISDGSVRSVSDGTSNTVLVGEGSSSSTTPSPATSGLDFNALPGTITLQPGEDSKLLTVTPIDDAVPEGRESVTISLSPDALYTIGASRTAVGFIDDNDQAPIALPVVQIAVDDPNGSETGPRPIVFRFTRSGNLSSQLTVNYAVNPTTSTGSISDGSSNTVTFGETSSGVAASSGVDFIAVPGTISFQPGESSKQLNVVPIDDSIIESRESVRVSLLASRLYTLGLSRSAVGFIDDNDQVPPVVSISATQPNASEEGPIDGTFTVSRTGGSLTQSLTVFYSVNPSSTSNIPNPATNGVDFEQLSGQVVIPAGSASATIIVRPLSDNEQEPEERVVLQLLAPSPQAYTTQAGSSQATVKIKDNHRP